MSGYVLYKQNQVVAKQHNDAVLRHKKILDALPSFFTSDMVIRTLNCTYAFAANRISYMKKNKMIVVHSDSGGLITYMKSVG